MLDNIQAVGGGQSAPRRRCSGVVCGGGLALLALVGLVGGAGAATPTARASDGTEATASAAARKSAIQSIPFDKLSSEDRAKVNAVLANTTVYRRLPIRVVNCDPDLYLFLVRHPDVVVNIWEVLGVSQLQLRQTDAETFRVVESEGTSARLEFLYHSHDTHIVYGEWSYTGSILARRVTGRCLAILKTAFQRETDGRYYATSRLDGFMSVDQGGAELLTRALHSLAVKNVDNNFIQTVSFLGSVSKTAEVNTQGMQKLSARLSHVQPRTREQLNEVILGVAQRAAANTARAETAPKRVATRPSDETER